jgi:hypothetical protein
MSYLCSKRGTLQGLARSQHSMLSCFQTEICASALFHCSLSCLSQKLLSLGLFCLITVMMSSSPMTCQ